jgi:hypothetical protein
LAFRQKKAEKGSRGGEPFSEKKDKEAVTSSKPPSAKMAEKHREPANVDMAGALA